MPWAVTSKHVQAVVSTKPCKRRKRSVSMVSLKCNYLSCWEEMMAKEVIALIDDLFFSSKIASTAQSCGVPVQFLKTKDALIEKVKRQSAGLIIVDLNGST